MTRRLTFKSFSFCCVFASSFLILIQAAIISDYVNTSTIKWYSNITAEKVEADNNPDPAKHLAERTILYKKINGSVLLQGTNFTSQYPDSISLRTSPGFVDTVFYSYQNHHNLIIRPDDVWTAIIVQFSLYVNANAEALRHAFVNFHGKKELEVQFYQPIDKIQISEFIEKIVALIDENIDPKVSSWIKPNFTTTTENDKLTASAALMATVQNYFDYQLSAILCGIPEVTILGNVDDWKNIRQRVEALKAFELNGENIMATWSTMLLSILDEFVRVKQGSRKNDEFWREAIRIDYEIVDLICAKTNESYLNGWITTFSAFDKSGKWNGDKKIGNSANWLRIRTDNITPGVVHVPIKIYDEFARQNYTGAIITGHMGFSVKMDRVTLQPLSGWAMTITGTPPVNAFTVKSYDSVTSEKIEANNSLHPSTTITGTSPANTLTVKWYDNVTAEKVEADKSPEPKKHLAERTTLYDSIEGSILLQGTNFTSHYSDSISLRTSPGFVDTVFYSYQNHHNLMLRPDDVWTAIIVQFSLYVNANAEALRHSFVNFEGKKELEVQFYQPIDKIQISEFIEKIVALIDENIDPKVSSWIKPDFTTTTENDKLTAGAALMATLQNYFDYQLSLILCGIPEVTILGNVDDWKNIRQRVERLKEFELNGKDVMATWSTMLGRILDEFVRVKEGLTKDDEFWRQAIRIDYEIVDLICAKINETYLNGWITAFSAFDMSGKWNGDKKIGNSDKWLRIRTDDITPGVVHVPIKIYDEFAKPEQQHYTGAIITGHMGHSVKLNEVTLQPVNGWAMAITGTHPDYLEYKRNGNLLKRENLEILK